MTEDIHERQIVRNKRQSIRLKGYDYAQEGAYFVTVCTKYRACWFGNIEHGKMNTTSAGSLVRNYWETLPGRFNDVQLDVFVLMPNHIHGIVFVGAQFIAPVNNTSIPGCSIDINNILWEKRTGAMNRAPTLGQIVRTFKAASTRAIRKTVQPLFAWQRNYHEHIIRNEESLNHIREYITNNPLHWEVDRENPLANIDRQCRRTKTGKYKNSSSSNDEPPWLA
jgi:putative transposase